MINFGWQFYRNYYKGIEQFPIKEKYSDFEKEQQENFFKQKNNVFFCKFEASNSG